MIEVKSTSKEDMNEKEWLRVVSDNAAFNFLKETGEDIYTLSEGKPFNGQGVK